jgi:hypothetical protein
MVSEIYTTTFTHAYLTAGFSPDAPKTHACLRFGYWCTSNALEHPLLAIRFLIRKMKSRTSDSNPKPMA